MPINASASLHVHALLLLLRLLPRSLIPCHARPTLESLPRPPHFPSLLLVPHSDPHISPPTHRPLVQISLMPASAEEKTLEQYFPALKLGGKKR